MDYEAMWEGSGQRHLPYQQTLTDQEVVKGQPHLHVRYNRGGKKKSHMACIYVSIHIPSIHLSIHQSIHSFTCVYACV